MTRSFINVSENHRKFYHITLNVAAKQVVIRFGRIGTAGQQQVKRFDYITAARTYFFRMVDTRYAHGYEAI